MTIIGLTCALGCAGRSDSHVHNGVLDLSTVRLDEQTRLRLDGTWEFCFNRFVPPRASFPDQRFVQLPGYWNEQPEQSKTTEGQGFASYRLRVFLNPQDRNRTLALYIPHAFTAYRLFVNGVMIAQNGTPGETRELTRNEFLPLAASFRSETEETEILIYVANFTSDKGGFRQSLELGTEAGIVSYKQFLLSLDLFLIGSILAVSIYHLCLFFLRRSEVYALYFGLWSLDLILYKMTTGEYFIMMLFPSLPWPAMMKLFFLSMYLATPLFLAFVNAVYPEESNLYFVHFNTLVFGVLAVAVVVIDESWIEQTLIYAEALIVAACAFSFLVFLRAAFRRRDGALAFLFGFSLYFAAIINDILFERDVIRTEILAPAGMFGLLMSHSGALLKRFTRLLITVEAQQIELKRSVELKDQLYRSRLRSRRLEFEALKKSIQPHFLVNSLAAIRGWLIEDPAKSVSLLDDFAAEIRGMQSIVNRTRVPISSELTLCRAHLNVMGTRREKSYKIYVRGVSGNESIPPLIFHTMVENAFSHLDSENGTLVFFLVKQSANFDGEPTTVFLFVVKNTGKERSAKRKGAGLGLRYVMTRLEESYPGAWSLDQRKTARKHTVEIRIRGVH